MKKKILVSAIAIAFITAGCGGMSKTQKGAAIGSAVGTAVGAGVGYAVGGKKGAAIGAGSGLVVGGLTGAAIGRYMDRQEEELRQAMASQEAASVSRQQDVLEVTFKSDFLFDIDSAILKPGAAAEIDRVAAVLNKYPKTTIRIEGYTDSSGPEQYNQELSEQRAEAVKNALITKGVTPQRMVTVGLGESNPIASNQTAEGRQMNRRVNVVITPIKG